MICQFIMMLYHLFFDLKMTFLLVVHLNHFNKIWVNDSKNRFFDSGFKSQFESFDNCGLSTQELL